MSRTLKLKLCFNVVTSSFGTTKEMVAKLKNSLREKCPTLVLGGHAVTLHPNEFIQHSTFQWDYLVLGDGERPLLDIVQQGEALKYSSTSGIVHQSKRPAILPLRADLKSEQWDALPWVDHGIYRDPHGIPYEPSPSRNGNCKEAHVVMSRGCAWKCSFCTEAILRGSDGEVRRSAEDVIEEIKDLVDREGANRIQFIDDNLLPQIAARGVDEDSALRWTDSFLTGLSELFGRRPDFAWRGIFRFEDFLRYQERRSDWLEKLKNSGCMLLAFGVEHGSEDRRKKLKAGSVSNEEISRVIKALAAQGIATKGYFIVGGENENQESTSHSINLAISAGFSLAYFALYKDFRKLVQRSLKGTGTVQERERKFMRFDSLVVDLMATFANFKRQPTVSLLSVASTATIESPRLKTQSSVWLQPGFVFRTFLSTTIIMPAWTNQTKHCQYGRNRTMGGSRILFSAQFGARILNSTRVTPS